MPARGRFVVVVTSLLACAAVAAVCCSTAGATDINRAPLSSVFKEWRAEQTDDSRAAATDEELVPAPVGAGALGATSTSDDESPSTPSTLTATVLPSSYDLRDEGGLTQVRDQGSFGTCWAFACFGSLESTLLVSGAGDYDFSEDNLARKSGFSLSPYYGGGNALMATAYLARWAGPVLESDDAYGDNVTPSGLTAVKHVQDVVFLPERAGATDNDAIKTAVMEHGAVMVSMYFDGEPPDYNSSTASWYRANDPGESNHAVAIVGWDDDYAAANFATAPAGNGAFIVRNSWSDDWGDGGYFYVSYYDATLGRGDGWCEGSTAVFTGADTDNYDAVYQYDPLGFVNCCAVSKTNRGVGWMANRFTASDDGSLRAVGFYTLGESSAYQVYVGSGLSLSSSALAASGTLDEAGYHTVSLSSCPAVTDGSSFYVMIRLETPGNTYPIALEEYCAGYSEAARSSSKQSYVAVDFNGSPGGWKDLGGATQPANVCIKAFTWNAPTTAASGLASSASSGWTNADPVTVSLSTTGGRGTTTTSYRVGGGDWSPYASAFDVSGEGSHAVRYYSVDAEDDTESVQKGYVNIDTRKPRSVAKRAVVKRAKAKKRARLSLRVTVRDATPSSGRVKLVTTITTRSGFRLGRTTKTVRVNKTSTVRVRLTRTLRRGGYYIVTRATDAAGNVQAKVGKVRLRVK